MCWQQSKGGAADRDDRVRGIFGLVLAGGRSSRMGGGEKALLDLAGTALLDRAIARLSPQVEKLAINANRELAAYEARGLPVLTDVFGGYQGPLAGVLTGLRWAEEAGADHLATVAGDTPFFPLDLVAQLCAALSAATPIAMAQTEDGRHPTFALWPVALAGDLEAALAGGTRKIIAWTDAHGCAKVPFAADGFDPFFNVNTPDDMAAANELARERGL